VGSAWRCLSLAPAYHENTHNRTASIPYCPLARETLTYIERMADHPNITTFTNTRYEGLDMNNTAIKNDEEKKHTHIAKLCFNSNPERQKKSTTLLDPTRTVILAVGYDTHRSGEP
jgi:hypothetical protein